MKHIMRLNASPFDKIINGTKTIELRLNDEKRRKINCGDEITFVNREENNKTVTAKVLKLYRYNSFKDLYSELSLEKCGYAQEEIISAKPEDMLQYYSEEEQKKYGVLGIEIELI